MAAGDGDSSGYLYEEDLYVDTPPEAFSCPVCLCPVQRQPHLTYCCGKHFCYGCIAKVQTKGKACPMCNATDTFTIFPNKERQREINQLKVRCPNAKVSGDNEKNDSSGGCAWVGELGEVEKHVSEKHGGFNPEETPAVVHTEMQRETEELNSDACCSASQSDSSSQQPMSCERAYNQQSQDRNLFTGATPPDNTCNVYSDHGDNVYSNHGDERRENLGESSGNVQQVGELLSSLTVSSGLVPPVPDPTQMPYTPPPPWGPPPPPRGHHPWPPYHHPHHPPPHHPPHPHPHGHRHHRPHGHPHGPPRPWGPHGPHRHRGPHHHRHLRCHPHHPRFPHP